MEWELNFTKEIRKEYFHTDYQRCVLDIQSEHHITLTWAGGDSRGLSEMSNVMRDLTCLKEVGMVLMRLVETSRKSSGSLSISVNEAILTLKQAKNYVCYFKHPCTHTEREREGERGGRGRGRVYTRTHACTHARTHAHTHTHTHTQHTHGWYLGVAPSIRCCEGLNTSSSSGCTAQGADQAIGYSSGPVS